MIHEYSRVLTGMRLPPTTAQCGQYSYMLCDTLTCCAMHSAGCSGISRVKCFFSKPPCAKTFGRPRAASWLLTCRRQIPHLLVGGILGPRGDAYDLNKEITATSAEDYHAVQLSTLKTAGVDFVSAQTFNNVPEAVGACRASSKLNVPLSVALTLDSTCRLKSGPTLGEAITEIDAQTGEDAPDFYLLNCSHPVEYEPALENAGWVRRLRGVRPNASKMEKLALCKLGHLEDGDPVELGAQIGDLAKRHPHMDVFGGCCGTGDRHLREIAKALGSRRS